MKDGIFKKYIKKQEEELVEQYLKENKYNEVKTSKILGIARGTLRSIRKRIKREN